MKKLFLILAIAGICLLEANAQTKIPDTHRTCKEQKCRRTEIILPQVNGYNCYKADLHVHTIYSDGDITPRQRVREAWYDGLDILALTDHLEARRYTQNMLNALAPFNADGKPYKYHPAGSARLLADGSDPGITTDMNATFEEAEKCLKKEGYPMLLIKGTEISRKPQTEGHFNALFINDIQGIYNIDTKETFRNVHKQGGIVIHNHPSYRRDTSDKNAWQEEVYKEGLIDGVEVVNGLTFYPKIVRRCIDEKLIMIGGSDTHRPTRQYTDMGVFRTMTIIFAKENTEAAIKEALLKRRTITYSGGDLIGEEKWLVDFLNAAIDCRLTSTTGGKKKESHIYTLTNRSSITIRLRRSNTIYVLEPFKPQTTSYSPNAKTGIIGRPKFTVENMWHADYKHPVVELKID